jgi:hypothetical protein
MADDKDREGISAATFYGGMAIMSISLNLVLAVSARPEDSWIRIAVQWILIAQTFLWLGGMLWLRFRKKAPQGPPA